MDIKKVTDAAFHKYGRMVKGQHFSKTIEAVSKVSIPESVVYEASVPELEQLDEAVVLRNRCFGEIPIQVGYCIGHNTRLNAVEYHRSSEINIAVTDAILILGQQQDITQEYQYDTANMEAFLIPEGTAVELYATTLHFAPCQTNAQGFQVIVVLPAQTNAPLDEQHTDGEDRLLAAKNKWLIGHPQGGMEDGTYIGLVGENLEAGSY